MATSTPASWPTSSTRRASGRSTTGWAPRWPSLLFVLVIPIVVYNIRQMRQAGGTMTAPDRRRSARPPPPKPASDRGSQEAKQRLTSPWASLAAVVIATLWTIPTAGLLISSFRPENDVKSSGWWTSSPTRNVTLDNYRAVLERQRRRTARHLLRQLDRHHAARRCIIPITLATLAAYAFAWMKFPGRDTLFVAVFAMQIVPDPGHDDPAAHPVRGPAVRAARAWPARTLRVAASTRSGCRTRSSRCRWRSSSCTTS